MFKYSILFTVLVVALSLGVRADEGMWLFNRLPLKQLKEDHGFVPEEGWSEHLMKSSVRFNNGGSGSFVSSNGLVLTNHHVAADTLYKVSSATHNYLQDGFLAKNLDEEIPAPDLELNQLMSIEVVTDQVNAVVTPGMSAADASAARRAVIAKIEKESLQKTGLRSNVVTLYRGGEYHLYRYKKYTDVRVVFAPESAAAFFGGDADNFEYPRYCLDMTLMRVYENGKPAVIDHHLKWSAAGADESELVFVSGNPGRTNRMYTTEALTFLRDSYIPYRLSVLRQREILLQQYGQESQEHARQARDDLFGVQNSRKAYTGMLSGLQDSALMVAKQKAEYELRAAVAADPALKGLGGAWSEVTSAKAAQGRLLVPYSLLEGAHGFDSRLFSIARTLVRMAEEDLKPNAERLAEFQDANRDSLEQGLFSTAPLYPEFEIARLSGSLSYLVERLGEQHPAVRRALQGQSPQARAEELVRETALADVNVRKLLARGGKALVDQSYDPMIRMASDIDEASREVRKLYEEQVEEVETQAYAKIAKALFAVYGTGIYPDATFTLRLAYGVVRGYQEAGKTIPFATNLGGAFEHEAVHKAQDPWKLPQSWHDAKDQLDLSTPFNFVSTLDIIGGNSGSPVVNRAGELVGLIFDGNIQSLSFNYAYSEKQARAVSVHSRAMLEVLEKVYGAKHLVDELK